MPIQAMLELAEAVPWWYVVSLELLSLEASCLWELVNAHISQAFPGSAGEGRYACRKGQPGCWAPSVLAASWAYDCAVTQEAKVAHRRTAGCWMSGTNPVGQMHRLMNEDRAWRLTCSAERNIPSDWDLPSE